MTSPRRPQRILDAHHHFWDLDGPGSYPWLQDEYDDRFFLGNYRPMRQTFLPEQYRRATSGFNVVATVHVEAERSRTEQLDETKFLDQLHHQDPRFPVAVVGHAHFHQSNLSAVLEHHAQFAIVKGIRCKPRVPEHPGEKLHDLTGTLRDPRWQAGLASLAEFNFSWDMRVPWWSLDEAAAVLADLPNIPTVVNHCGLPLDRSADGLDGWKRGMESLAKLPNVSVKVSELGLPHNVWDPISSRRVVSETISIFGYKRCMFASNLPVGLLTAPSFSDIIDVVLAALPHATEEDLDQLFRLTAAQFYRINLIDVG